MKSKVIIVTVALALMGCEARRDYPVITTTNGQRRAVEKYSFEGHDYIEFFRPGETCGVVHSPDCKKCFQTYD